MDARYRIEQKLAVGGFGAIYRATDTVVGREVALKILHPELASDANVVARFRREIAALAKLKSSHTLTLYDIGRTPDTLYFVMELLRGESLYDVFMRTGPLGWRRLAHIARGVCSSLREAHAHGIVHRDLKPENIFLEQHALDIDHVKVLDFGIAKILASSELENADLTRHGQMIGTFAYMSPEQMVGGACTSRSDVFTLGVVMYEMLSGVRPYGEATGPAQLLMALMNHTPVPLTGVPPELSRMIMQCLSREATDRLAVEQLDQVLASLLDIDEAAFSDADEPTLIAARAPRPHARSMPLRAPLPSVMSAAQADVPFARTMQQAAQREGAHSLDSQSPAIIARGSQAAIARDIELALASTMSSEVDARAFVATGTDASGASMSTGDARGAPLSGRAFVPRLPEVDAQAFGATGTDARGASLSRAVDAAKRDARGASLTRVPRLPEVAVRFQPTPNALVPTPKSRLAAGTSPIANETEAQALVHRAPPPRAPALVVVRYATIAACLFGLGFVGALAIWSL